MQPDPAPTGEGRAVAVVDLAHAGHGSGPRWGMQSEELNATLLAWPPGHEIAEHVNSERDVLMVVLEGSAWVAVDGVGHLVAADQLLLLARGCARSITAGAGGVRYLSTHLRRGPLLPTARAAPMTPATVRRDAPLRIREALASSTGGRSVRELVDATRLHENAVRRTLATLVADSAVSVERRRSHARGRPLLLYRLVGAADEPSRPSSPCCSNCSAHLPPRPQTAYATGFAHGASTPAPGSQGTREALVASLANYGFAPVERTARPPAPAILDLTRCPFRDAVTVRERPPDLPPPPRPTSPESRPPAAARSRTSPSTTRATYPCRARFRERRVEVAGPAMRADPEAPLAILQRWEAHGATWRTVTLTEKLAVVELCTCYGTPVDQLRSSDPELLRFLNNDAATQALDAAPPAERGD